MFSSDGEWEEALAPPSVATSQAPASRRVTRESSTGQSVVSSGLSDLEGQPNYVKGLAQRATEPDYKQIREKGPFTVSLRMSKMAPPSAWHAARVRTGVGSIRPAEPGDVPYSMPVNAV